MNNFNFPLLSTGYGRLVMDSKNDIYKRVDSIEEINSEMNFLLQGANDFVLSFKGKKAYPRPIFVPNNVFSDVNGVSFIRAHEKTEQEIATKANNAGCGYIIARKQENGEYLPQAYLDGQEVDFPSILTNEMGVQYKFVDYAKYGEVCKLTHGYYLAKKIEPVYVFMAEAGEEVQAVLNGVQEHSTYLEEDDVKVQNAYHGETYKMKLKKLFKLYEFQKITPEGLQLWKPKDELQMWTFTNENIFGVLWGGFEFLAKAMINITNSSDVYGCNYEVFNGNDIANGSHQKIQLFLPINPIQLDDFQKHETAEGKNSVEEGVPKVEFVECSFPSTLFN